MGIPDWFVMNEDPTAGRIRFRAVVYFTAAPSRPIRLRTVVKMIRRKPLIAAVMLTARATRLFTRSPIYHVSVAVDSVVLDPSLWGDRLYDHDSYIAVAPHLWAAVIVPLVRMPDMTPRSRSFWVETVSRTIRWITGGRTTANDCVCRVIAVLSSGGFRVVRVVSPADLHKYLVSKGCRHATL